MQLAPLQPADSRLGPPPFGRVVKSTVDLAGPLDAGSREAINTALLEHGLLVIEAQHRLSAEMEWTFMSSFRWLDPEYSASLKSSNPAWWQFADYPLVRRLGDAVNEAGEPLGLLNRMGYEWHTDGGGATLLHCERAPKLPPRITLYASGATAYDVLPGALKAEAEAVVVHYSRRFVTGDTATIDYQAGVRMAPNGLRLAVAAKPCASRDRVGSVKGKGDHARPLVRVHPMTSRKVLWATPKNMDHLEIDGRTLSVEHSRAKLEELLHYGTATGATELVYAHHWKAGDVVLMDNRQVLHSTTPYKNDNDDHGQQLMHQISLKARRPQQGWTDVGPLRASGTTSSL